jgi:hypothetical protein
VSVSRPCLCGLQHGSHILPNVMGFSNDLKHPGFVFRSQQPPELKHVR